MKRIIYLALAGILLCGMISVFVSCNRGSNEGTLVCGVTIFPPMNFQDEAGNWTGFDTEFAQLVGAKLGMEVEFQVIDWGRKFIELQAGTIGCIWNGMTANVVDSVTGRPRYEDVDFSHAYMLNQQAVVIRIERAGEFLSHADLIGKTVAVEAGSAGETIARDAIGEDGQVIGTSAQIDTFIEVRSGAVDFGMVDILLAEQMTNSGDHAAFLMIAPIEMSAEVYAIGFPKGSPLVARVNQAIRELFDSGDMQRLGRKYGLESRIVLNTTRIEDM